MKTTEKLKTSLRASWRQVLESLRRLTLRARTGLEARIRRLPAR